MSLLRRMFSKEQLKTMGHYKHKLSLLVRHPFFDYFITLCIVASTAISSQCNPVGCTLPYEVVELSELVFACVFLAEFVLKVYSACPILPHFQVQAATKCRLQHR